MTTLAERPPASAIRQRLLAALGQPWAGVAILLAFYLVLILVFALLTQFFLTTRNLLAIGSNVAFIGLMAAAGTPLIIAGGLDLSVAAVAAMRSAGAAPRGKRPTTRPRSSTIDRSPMPATSSTSEERTRTARPRAASARSS